MTFGLTSRQTSILKALIDEYIQSAEPVGSLALEKKYPNLGVSPATIRSEMVALTKMKYLRQPHTSAGRIPTPLAMKFYINQLMEEREIGLAQEVRVKEDLKKGKDDFDKLMSEATQELADQTHCLAIGGTDNGEFWRAGFSNLFEAPEFFEAPLVCKNIFSFLEAPKTLYELLFEKLTGINPIEVLFGEEFGLPFFEPVGIVASRFDVRGKTGAIGVVTPVRLSPQAIPVVRYFSNIIQEMTA